MSVVDGWGDEEELNVTFDDGDLGVDPEHGNDDDNHIENDENAWDDDDLDFDDDDDDIVFDDTFGTTQPLNVGESTRLVPSVTNAQNTTETMVENLNNYIHDLGNGTLLNTANQMFGSKLNNGEEALELCRYYHDRPQLRDYTLNTEVPRMDYQVMISDEVVLTETFDIQKHFSDYPVDDLVDDMLLRSSNQSLLADAFQIITGPDGIVRNQFLATAVATTCRFVLDMRRSNSNQPRRHVQADCQMMIGVPSGEPSQSKLNLATLRLLIHFCPEPAGPPSIKYEIVSIRPLLNPSVQTDELRIRHAAESLEEHDMLNDASSFNNTSPNDTNARDNFIQSITSTQSGFKSALKDIDNVINVSSKLNILKSVTSALPSLPTVDDIMDASGVQDQVLPNNSTHNTFIGTRTNGMEQEEDPSKMREPLMSETDAPLSRPKPIMGGLLLSGIERLAKAAALPDVSVLDFDNQVAPQEEGLKLYKVDEETLPLPVSEPKAQLPAFSLNRRDDFMPDRHLPPPPPPPTKSVSPKIAESPMLKNHDQESNMDKEQSNIQVEENIPISLNDQGMQSQCDEEGWSDDDSLVDDQPLDTQDDVDLTDAVPTKELGRKSDDDSLKNNVLSLTKSDPLLQALREISNCSVDTNTFVAKDFNYEPGGTIPTRKRFISRSEILQKRIQDIY